MIAIPPRVKNRVGQVFGRLTVLRFSHTDNRHAVWTCRCSCGRFIDVPANRLQSGNTRSCGCLSVDASKARNPRIFIKHGHARKGRLTPEYTAWMRMNQRCGNENNPKYPDYGGRGIRVCDRWRDSFAAFLADMGPRPSANHSIDRIDVNGDYEPKNCRWATLKQQARNKRNTRLVEHEGQAKTLAEWAEVTGINSGTIHDRIARGWTIEQALKAI